ncbi:hypothetical protein BTO05_07980 [Winogradskyella sp. PC-19]|uniref:hypothetical protein n=1 Tax=unclassified Winogradskyella TaxID=2615021 RepID=UPI000B3CFFBD|nr:MULTISPECIES: hypothetical protein [unclassified Winogradskyella]ARV09580.1 hypothetical protein BTO05_07980 [Winogradskyella sp. PC-19]RZN83434.1 MAG: hypothetical protein EVB12_01620 [Winogradskyella sp.]
MKFKYIIVLSFFLVFIACGDKTEGTLENLDVEVKQEKKKISVKAIENFKYNDYILSDDSKSEVSDWSKFQELETQISFLKKADITFFTTEKDTLKKFLDSLRVNIPNNINTNPVNSRITTLETKLLKLNNDLTLDNYSTENKLMSIKELLIANSNLIFVINKKLEFDKNDVGRPED